MDDRHHEHAEGVEYAPSTRYNEAAQGHSGWQHPEGPAVLSTPYPSNAALSQYIMGGPGSAPRGHAPMDVGSSYTRMQYQPTAFSQGPDGAPGSTAYGHVQSTSTPSSPAVPLSQLAQAPLQYTPQTQTPQSGRTSTAGGYFHGDTQNNSQFASKIRQQAEELSRLHVGARIGGLMSLNLVDASKVCCSLAE
eukprot:gb/GECG01014428.1/.p1 GENE.gb/GECG01014428.1/~~gb/GECG01014428.1/.p1  ORF type:complete len:192 (+),score=14.32 gb/GECG01014428.1/:1-576(+)